MNLPIKFVWRVSLTSLIKISFSNFSVPGHHEDNVNHFERSEQTYNMFKFRGWWRLCRRNRRNQWWFWLNCSFCWKCGCCCGCSCGHSCGFSCNFCCCCYCSLCDCCLCGSFNCYFGSNFQFFWSGCCGFCYGRHTEGCFLCGFLTFQRWQWKQKAHDCWYQHYGAVFKRKKVLKVPDYFEMQFN